MPTIRSAARFPESRRKVNDQHRQELLRSSAVYATARLGSANAIVIAQRAGETDEVSRTLPSRSTRAEHGADHRHGVATPEISSVLS